MAAKRKKKGPAKVGPSNVAHYDRVQVVLPRSQKRAEPPPEENREDQRKGHKVEFRQGVISLIDALGFRGIWTRLGPSKDDLARAFLKIQKNWSQRKWLENALQESTELNIIAFSDTILFCGFPRTETCSMNRVLARVVYQTALAVTKLANVGPGLAYRGCIGVGLVDAVGQIVVGPGIDDVAEKYEQADAAAIWLTADAVKISEPLRPLVLDWGVPLKNRGEYLTKVVNPLTAVCERAAMADRAQQPTRAQFERDLDDQVAAFLKPLDSAARQLDVAFKKQRTTALLEMAKSVSLKWFDDGMPE